MSGFRTEEYQAALALGHDRVAPLPPLGVDGRIAKLQTLLNRGVEAVVADSEILQSQALLVTNPANIRYLTGFTGSSGRVLVSAVGAILVTDARYEERAAEELAKAHCSARIVILRTVAEQDAFLTQAIASAGVVKLGLEADHVSWHDAERYRAFVALAEGEGELIAETDAVERLRRTKEPAEVARLARASTIADDGFAQVLPLLSKPITERDFASALEDAMRAYGSEEPSFSTIIAAGTNASRPHHEPGNHVIQEGDEVICDFGATCEGYRSDMTRTVYVGEPSLKQLRHFAVVQQAHDAGIDAVVPGVSGLAVDAQTRQVIIHAGWGEFFVHGTGHGSGLLIHEAPWIGPTSTSILAAGDIVTVEPGVYLPGAGGVRIEDSMLITDGGPLLLTRSPYNLVVPR